MRRLAALTLLGALTLVGCGDGPSYTHARGSVLTIDLDEYTLRPENIEVPAGTIHLVARNHGRLTHNLAIEALDREEGEEATTYGRTDTLQPGQTGRERAPITLKPGKYRLVCTIGNHDDLGQYGELKVVAKGS
jgi:uncharacterized cupredoxin-like copper-binding protein